MSRRRAQLYVLDNEAPHLDFGHADSRIRLPCIVFFHKTSYSPYPSVRFKRRLGISHPDEPAARMKTLSALVGVINPILSPVFMIYLGKLGRAFLGFSISLAVARWLGPEQFGLFSLFIAILIIGNDVLGEGLNPSVVRFYSGYRQTDPSRARHVFGSALILRMVLGIPIVLLGLFGGQWLANFLWQDETYAMIIRLGLIGAFGAALWTFTLSVWQALEEFRTYALMTPLVNLLRICSLPILVSLGLFTLDHVLLLHVGFFYLCALIGLIQLRSHLTRSQVNWSILCELLTFGQWTAVANLFFLLQAHLGIPFLTYFSNAEQAGIYSAGTMLLLMIDHLTSTLLTVLLPKASKLDKLSDYQAYVKRCLSVCSVAALFLVPFLVIGPFLTLWMYGPSYQATGEIFQVLFAGFLATLMTHPLYLIFYAMNRPQLYTWSAGISLICWIAIACWLIPGAGAVGAAWATLGARLFQSIMIGGFVWLIVNGRWVLQPRATGM